MRFVVDSMLGKLAKWLRIMGYDTHYQSFYRPEDIDQLVEEGRCLLSRHKGIVDRFSDAVLISGNHVGEQLSELRESILLDSNSSSWFTRCLICNSFLKEGRIDIACENVPEYVFYQNMKQIRFCPLCRRYYWQGSHRKRMLKQLEEWGFKSSSMTADSV